MNRIILAGIAFFGALVASPAEITFESLLREMRDRSALAQFPEPAYRQLQASSYNRQSVARDQPDQGVNGWFADSDGISCLREETVNGRKEWVLMEHDGPGCLTKFWTPFFYYHFNNRVGPVMRIYLDGAATPVMEERFIELLTRNDWDPAKYGRRPERQNKFRVPSPFADFTARAGNLYLPIPFARHCKVTLDDKPFYHIVNYRAYPAGTAVRTFTPQQYVAAKELLAQVGRELLQPSDAAGGVTLHRDAVIAPGGELQLALPAGPAAIQRLEFHLDPATLRDDPSPLRAIVLRLSFDGAETVWCPLGDFFGSPNALNPFHTWTRTVTAEGKLTCRWVMPYRQSARLGLHHLGKAAVRVQVAARTGKWTWTNKSMHFYARWRSDDVLPGNRFVDWNFADIRGQGVWVGDQWTVLNLTRGWWGEGDEKIYVDDAYDGRKFPDHFGTGTEDYYGWAGGVNPTREDVFSHPFLANISVGSTDASNTRGFNICTRLRALDGIPFQRRLVFDMEASPGVSQRNAWNLLGYSAVAFWYARPGAISNRPPLPAAAARPLMALAALAKQSEVLRQRGVRRREGAIEFETLQPTARAAGVRVGPQLPAPSFHPDQLSGRRHSFIQFHQPGDFVEYTLTEQFKPVRGQLVLSRSYDFGVVNVRVNGRLAAKNVDLYSSNLTLLELDLGRVEPVNNAITFRIELVRPNPRSRGAKTLAGVDCVVLRPAAP